MKKLIIIIFLVLMPGILIGCNAAQKTATNGVSAQKIATTAAANGVRAQIIGHWLVVESRAEGETTRTQANGLATTYYDFTSDKMNTTSENYGQPYHETVPYSWIDDQTIGVGGTPAYKVSFDNGRLVLSGYDIVNGVKLSKEIILEKR